MALLADMQRQASVDAAAAPRQLKALGAEIARLVDAVAAVGISPALQQRLRTAEAERERLAQPIEQAKAGPRQVIEDVLARYRRQVLELQRVLEEDADRERTRELLRQMLGPVILLRDAEGLTWAQMTNPAEQLLCGFCYRMSAFSTIRCPRSTRFRPPDASNFYQLLSAFADFS